MTFFESASNWKITIQDHSELISYIGLNGALKKKLTFPEALNFYSYEWIHLRLPQNIFAF